MARPSPDDDAPWLAAADGRETTTVSRRSIFWTAAVLLALAAVAVIGIILLVARKEGGSTAGYMDAEQAPLIAAEPGPYKVKPDDPQGLAVEGQDQIIYGTGAGADQAGTIDRSAVPEEPIGRPGSTPSLPNAVPEAEGPPRDLLPSEARSTTTPATAPPPKPAARPPLALDIPATAKPPAKAADALPAKAVADVKSKPDAKPAADAPKPAAHQTVQLGAFQSAEAAEAEWAKSAARLDGFTHSVTPVERDGKTLYRLRATGPGSACDKLGRSGCMAVK